MRRRVDVETKMSGSGGKIFSEHGAEVVLGRFYGRKGFGCTWRCIPGCTGARYAKGNKKIGESNKGVSFLLPP